MNEKNLAKEELIGLSVRIINSTDPSWEGKTGTIVDETKNTFQIEINNIRKTIGKKSAKFEFNIDDQIYVLDGKKIVFRPEDRIKKAR